MPYLDHKELLALAKIQKPENPANTVSSFSCWVFGLYMRSCSASMKLGKAGEFEIERQAREGKRSKPLSEEYQLEFCDPLDGSRGFQISSLMFLGRPMRGVPDLVYRVRATGEIVVVERKCTGSRPADWPNLKVQLWCYGRIDRWKDAPSVRLVGSVYEPRKYGFNHSTKIGDWRRGHGAFDTECRELFELFGGIVTD